MKQSRHYNIIYVLCYVVHECTIVKVYMVAVYRQISGSLFYYHLYCFKIIIVYSNHTDDLLLVIQ